MFEQLSGRSKVQWEELQQQMLTMRETLMAEMGLADEGAEQSTPAARRSRSAGRGRSEQSAEQEETVE